VILENNAVVMIVRSVKELKHRQWGKDKEVYCVVSSGNFGGWEGRWYFVVSKRNQRRGSNG